MKENQRINMKQRKKKKTEKTAKQNKNKKTKEHKSKQNKAKRIKTIKEQKLKSWLVARTFSPHQKQHPHTFSPFFFRFLSFSLSFSFFFLSLSLYYQPIYCLHQRPVRSDFQKSLKCSACSSMNLQQGALMTN